MISLLKIEGSQLRILRTFLSATDLDLKKKEMVFKKRILSKTNYINLKLAISRFKWYKIRNVYLFFWVYRSLLQVFLNEKIWIWIQPAQKKRSVQGQVQ